MTFTPRPSGSPSSSSSSGRRRRSSSSKQPENKQLFAMRIRCEHCYATFRGNPLKDRCPKCRYKVHRNLERKEIALSLLVPGYGWFKTFNLWKSVPVASLQSLLLSVVSTGFYVAAVRAVIALE